MKLSHLCAIVAGLLLLAAATFTVEPPGVTRSVSGDVSRIWDNQTYINANKILMFVTNHGNFGRDLSGVFGRDAGTFYPYVSIEDIQNGTLDAYALYAAGIWIGGRVNGLVRVAVAEYSDEYVPGPMVGGAPSRTTHRSRSTSCIGTVSPIIRTTTTSTGRSIRAPRSMRPGSRP